MIISTAVAYDQNSMLVTKSGRTILCQLDIVPSIMLFTKLSDFAYRRFVSYRSITVCYAPQTEPKQV